MSELKEGLRFFFSAHCLIMPYFVAFHEEILNDFSYRVDGHKILPFEL